MDRPEIEGWLVAGDAPGMIPLREDVCGMPYVLRASCDLMLAGCTRVLVIWRGASDPPEIADLVTDKRLRGVPVTIHRGSELPAGPDVVVVLRGDRVYHRDLPKAALTTCKRVGEPATVAGQDAALAGSRAVAAAFAATLELPATSVQAVAPYLAFSVPVVDRASKRRAEKLLVWSQRKEAQGIAAYWINRHLSLPTTRAIMRTEIVPNQVTVFCFLIALSGGIVIGRGGYWAGLIGMALVNLGSILDGVDGELARLKYRFSALGQWLDTLADDFGNVAYISGIGLNLHAAGVAWAGPLAIVALICFALTQTTQYALIKLVYKSGDLAAIPWAFQSTEFLTAKPKGLVAWIKATLPKTLKRDFALTMFVVAAALGRLDFILLVFSAGAIVFFLVFVVQLVRNFSSIRQAGSAT